jgi:hypothetical protein
VTDPPKVPVLVPEVLLKTIFAVVRSVMRLLLASLAVRVTVMLDPEATVLLETVTTDVESDKGPTVTVTAGLALVRACALTEAPIEVAVPAVTPVKVFV